MDDGFVMRVFGRGMGVVSFTENWFMHFFGVGKKVTEAVKERGRPKEEA